MARSTVLRVLPQFILLFVLAIYPTLAQSPSITSGVAYQGNCVWHVSLYGSGFAPNSTMYIDNTGGSETNCSGQAYSISGWSNWEVGSTDENGNFSIALIHGGYGTYYYNFHDAQGNSASTVVSYASEALPSTPVPPSQPTPAPSDPTSVPIITGYNPSVSAPSISLSGDCRWDLWFALNGFAPNSQITVSSNYSATNCIGQQSNSSWSGAAGTTDGNGEYYYGVVHQDTGTYTYTFSDQQGNRAVVTFTTTPDSPIVGVTNPPPPIPNDCSQSLGNGLPVGASARVNSNAGTANLRSNPTTSASTIQSLPNGTTMTIVEGSVCAESYWWWKVDVNGTQGWVAGQLLEIISNQGITPTHVPTDIPAVQPPATLIPPLYPQAQVDDGVHVLNYCQAKYGESSGEYRELNNAYSWACETNSGRIQVDFQLACVEVYGEGWNATLSNATEAGQWKCRQIPGYVAPPVSNPIQPRSSNPRQCYVTEISREPAVTPVSQGTVLQFFYRVNCDNGLPRAVRPELDGQAFGEDATSEKEFSVDSSQLSLGLHQICLTGASHGDEYWERAARECFDYNVYDPNVPPPAENITQFSCPNTLESHLAIGMIGIVNTVTSSPIHVYHEAGVNSGVKFDLPAGHTFSVISGAECKDGYVWWEVGDGGNSGWAIETGSIGYDLVPNGTPLPYYVSSQLVPTSLPDSQIATPTLSVTEIVSSGEVNVVMNNRAPYVDCVQNVRLSGQNIEGSQDKLLENGFARGGATCDATSGRLSTFVVTFGGTHGSLLDYPNASQSAEVLAAIKTTYLPKKDGIVAITSTFVVNGKISLSSGSDALLPNSDIDAQASAALGRANYAPIGMDVIAGLLEILTSPTSSGLEMWSYIGVETGTASFYAASPVGEYAGYVTAMFPYGTPIINHDLHSKTVKVTTTVPVTAGQSIIVYAGMKNRASSYGWATSAWNLALKNTYVESVEFSPQ